MDAEQLRAALHAAIDRDWQALRDSPLGTGHNGSVELHVSHPLAQIVVRWTASDTVRPHPRPYRLRPGER